MKVGILFHLYQPPTLSESVFRQVVSECYVPLIKLIKSRKNQKFTLNVPLSLLEQMEKYGYLEWINDLRELVHYDRIELVGSAAYHPILTKTEPEFAESDIILNEYSLGYYFGSHQGFEGEPSVMMQNLDGFFPPEMAVNDALLSTVDSLGYKWIVVDETAIPLEKRNASGFSAIYNVSNLSTLVINRDRGLSNWLAFKRDVDISDFSTILSSRENSTNLFSLLSFDGETFGHHYKDGIYLLNNLLDLLSSRGIDVLTCSGLVREYEDQSTQLESIVESSWGCSDVELAKGDIYPFWFVKGNKIQKKLHELEVLLCEIGSYYMSNDAKNSDESLRNAPIWHNLSQLSTDEAFINTTSIYINIHRFLHSDKYWWVSNKSVADGQHMFDIGMTERSLFFAVTASKYFENPEHKFEVSNLVSEITALLKNI